MKALDGNGAPVQAFDSDWDGIPDSAETRVLFDALSLGTKTTFTRTATLSGIAANAPSFAKAEIALVSTSGARSSAITATLGAQTVAKMGAACDVSTLSSRCPASAACGGTPATCEAGSAPQIARAAYYGAASATKMVFAGTEPDQDLASLSIEFLTSGNQPVLVDLDGDGTPESTSFDLDLRARELAPAFVVKNDAAKSFGTTVPRIAVTPKDQAGNSGARKTVDLAAPAVRTAGQGCDADGFDACATGAVCAPGVAGATNKCATIASVRTSACTSAMVLDPAKGTSLAVGIARGASVWDPPAGCASDEAVGRPEGVAVLHLATPASSVTITTAVPETTADTVLYVLPACASADATPLACNDDTIGYASTVTLTNVAAGDYAIVVDMVQASGGRFGVKVTAN